MVNPERASQGACMNKLLTMLLGLGTLAGLAGCATPEEAGPGVDDGLGDDTGDDILPGDDTGDDGIDDGIDDGVDDGMGDNETGTPEYIMVNANVYECNDTIDLDGICDGYELNEGADPANAMDVTPEADGTLMIGGYTFRCTGTDVVDVDVVNETDSAGDCDEYERDE